MNVVKRWLLLAVISLGTAPTLVQALSLAAPPQISIFVANPIGVPVFSWQTNGGALQFDASVTSTLPLPVDVYFGVIIPGGRTFTWTSALTNVPILVEGLIPVAQNVTPTFFHAATSLGGVPQHTFSNTHPRGLYSVFVLLVAHGASPADASRWVAASMSPLMLSD
jgi:hypothetical protein